jgi:hypothetical protein
MKPSLREDLSSITAIGAGALASGLLTAALLMGPSGTDTTVTVQLAEEPHVDVHVEAELDLGADPELQVMHVPSHVRIDSPEAHVIVRRVK